MIVKLKQDIQINAHSGSSSELRGDELFDGGTNGATDDALDIRCVIDVETTRLLTIWLEDWLCC